MLGLVITALFWTHSAVADPAATQADFEKDLSQYIRTLDTSFYAFHYVSSADLGIPAEKLAASMSDTRVKDHFKIWTGAYSDPNLKAGGPIHAFYTALDPTASSGYGGRGDGWLLYRVELPRGLRYLEMEPEPLVPASIRSYLVQQGCDVSAVFHVDPSQFNYDHLLQGSYGPKCNKLVIATMKKLGIQAIAYEYDAIPIKGCATENDPSFLQRAFILIDPKSVDPGKVQVFSNSTSDRSPEGIEKQYLQALITPLDEDAAKHRWPSLDATATPAGFDAWKKAHLRNCQEPAAPTDCKQAVEMVPSVAASLKLTPSVPTNCPK